MPREMQGFTREAVDAWTKDAVRNFWEIRAANKARNAKTDKANAGNRGAATAGNHLDEFHYLFESIAKLCGFKDGEIFYKKNSLELPGYFRPTKQLDFLVIRDGVLVAAIEGKSQVGSFGNNINNRIEEALGASADMKLAFREKIFGAKTIHKPWLGYFLLLEEAEDSTCEVAVFEPHYSALEEFISPKQPDPKLPIFGRRDYRMGISYIKRYQNFGEKLILEENYDAACMILALADTPGDYTELPNLDMFQFAQKFKSHLDAMNAVLEVK